MNDEKVPEGYADKVARSKPGATLEAAADRKVKEAGLWRHPNGAELITQNDPLWGDGQGRAAERVGFVYVGPAPEGSIKTLVSVSDSHAGQPARAVEAADAYNKGVEARLNALEAVGARLNAQLASGTAVPGTEPVQGAEETKQAAEDKVADADPAYRDLQAQAKELGVNAKGSKEELTQRVADAKAEKVSE